MQPTRWCTGTVIQPMCRMIGLWITIHYNSSHVRRQFHGWKHRWIPRRIHITIVGCFRIRGWMPAPTLRADQSETTQNTYRGIRHWTRMLMIESTTKLCWLKFYLRKIMDIVLRRSSSAPWPICKIDLNFVWLILLLVLTQWLLRGHA